MNSGTATLLASSDAGLQSLVAMRIARRPLFRGGQARREDPVAMDALLQSSARASKHILGTALGLSADILLTRRDLAR